MTLRSIGYWLVFIALGVFTSCDAGVHMSAAPRWDAQRLTFLHRGVAAGPIAVTNADGSVAEERRYEPFGADLGVIDWRRFDLDGLNHRRDPETGWSYQGARWLDPGVARWLTPDPPVKLPSPEQLSDPATLHPHQYVSQNPIVFWDPDGNRRGLIRLLGLETDEPPRPPATSAPEPAEVTALREGLENERVVAGAIVVTSALGHGGAAIAEEVPFVRSLVLANSGDLAGAVGAAGVDLATVAVGAGTGKVLAATMSALAGTARMARVAQRTDAALDATRTARRWQDYLPQARERLAQAKRTYGDHGMTAAAQKTDIRTINKIVRDLGLSRRERRRLHDLITRQNLTVDEIRGHAADIVKSRRSRQP